MAASTDRDNLTTSAYTEVAASSVTGVVQHMGGSLVRIHVGTALPSADTEDYLLIGAFGDLPRRFEWQGFTTGDNVYARADTGTSVTVTVAA